MNIQGVVGIGAAKPASSVDDAAHNAQGESGSHTLGDLVSEGRNLAASVLHTAQTLVLYIVQSDEELTLMLYS